jgi:hypothetical protein
MFEQLIDAVKTMDKSFRNVFMGVAVTIVVVTALLLFDQSMKESRLVALDKSATILLQAQVMLKNDDPDIQGAARELKQQALQAIDEAKAPEPIPKYEKFGTAFAPWGLIFIVPIIFKSRENILTHILNSFSWIFIGLAFGAIGAVLPDSDLPGFNMLVYPIGHFVVIWLLLIYCGLNKAVESSGDNGIAQAD